MNYTITAVSPEVSSYQGMYGTMKVYTCKLQGVEGSVEISQKEDKPPVKAGDTVDGAIEHTAYGQRFKKTYTPNGPGASSKSNYSSDSKSRDDNITFYISYAKDLMVAYLQQVGAGDIDESTFEKIIGMVATGGMKLKDEQPVKSLGKEYDDMEEVLDLF
jgi:hypothetical protein